MMTVSWKKTRIQIAAGIFANNPEESVLMGSLRNASPLNIYGMIWEEVLTRYISRDLKESGGRHINVLGCAFAIRKSTFKAVWGFDEQFRLTREDADMKFKLREAGVKILYEKSMKASHFPRRSLGAYLKQNYKYGEGQYYLNKKWKERVRAYEKHMNFKTYAFFKELLRKYGPLALYMFAVFLLKSRVTMHGLRDERKRIEGT